MLKLSCLFPCFNFGVHTFIICWHDFRSQYCLYQQSSAASFLEH
uniref:Uncharacterized protein n=1 Tax=Arundo donax TaxID=35708 RepID=A0A0A9AI68_ARUDO